MGEPLPADWRRRQAAVVAELLYRGAVLGHVEVAEDATLIMLADEYLPPALARFTGGGVAVAYTPAAGWLWAAWPADDVPDDEDAPPLDLPWRVLAPADAGLLTVADAVGQLCRDGPPPDPAAVVEIRQRERPEITIKCTRCARRIDYTGQPGEDPMALLLHLVGELGWALVGAQQWECPAHGGDAVSGVVGGSLGG